MSTHIYPETSRFLGRESKETLLGQKGAVFWLCGLSGSGKSTIADRAERTLREAGRFTIALDGDTLRAGLNQGLGFSDEDRRENIRRIAEVCKILAGNGVLVFVSAITPKADLRTMAAEILGTDYREIYVKASFETCRSRDPKGLYAKAAAGQIAQFTGRDSGFEPPESPALVLDTETSPAEACAARLTEFALAAAERVDS